jgi:hypothetical protein
MQKALGVLPMAAGTGPHERTKDDLVPVGRATDPHSKRILLDHAEWYNRLTKLAKLREDRR